MVRSLHRKERLMSKELLLRELKLKNIMNMRL